MSKAAACLFLAILILTGFKEPRKAAQTKTYYAYVTATEWDKKLDVPSDNGYVNITTNIVAFECNIGASAVELRFMAYYKAREETYNRQLITSFPIGAWVYSSVDAAYASRKDWLSKSTARYKRIIPNFTITCKQ